MHSKFFYLNLDKIFSNLVAFYNIVYLNFGTNFFFNFFIVYKTLQLSKTQCLKLERAIWLWACISFHVFRCNGCNWLFFQPKVVCHQSMDHTYNWHKCDSFHRWCLFYRYWDRVRMFGCLILSLEIN